MFFFWVRRTSLIHYWTLFLEDYYWRPWSELHEVLLHLITNQLGAIDYLMFGSICKGWVGSGHIGNLLCLGSDFQFCGIRVFFFFFSFSFCTKTICACVIIVWISQRILSSMNRRIRKCLKASHVHTMKLFFPMTSGQRRGEERRERVKEIFFFLFIIR